MATFDCSGFKSGNNLDANELIAQVNLLPVKWSLPNEVDNSGSPVTTTSSSYSSLTSFTVDLEEDEVIRIEGRLAYSMNNSATLGAVHIYNSTDGFQPYPDSLFTQHDNSVTGMSATQFTISYDHSRSGSTTYQLRWRRAAGAGTIYSSYCQLSYMILKQR